MRSRQNEMYLAEAHGTTIKGAERYTSQAAFKYAYIPRGVLNEANAIISNSALSISVKVVTACQ